MGNDLLGQGGRDLYAGILRHLKGRSTQIQADDRPPSRHCFDADPTSGIVQAGMDQHIALRELLQNLSPRNGTQKVTLPATPSLRASFRSRLLSGPSPIIQYSAAGNRD